MIMRRVDNVVYKAAYLYFMHFGNKRPELVTCRDCCDYRLGLCLGFCSGSDGILDCMLDKAESSELFTSIY